MRPQLQPGSYTSSIFVVVNILCLCLRISGTQVCSECRSIDLQEAAGVGISLSPDHGSVSLVFTNGSSTNAGIIPGTPGYLAALRDLMDVPQKSTLPHHDMRLEHEEAESMASWRSVWHSFLQQFHTHTLASHSPSVPPTLEPISDMIRALFAVASTIHHLQHRTAFLALPNFVMNSTYAVSLIDPLLSGAGLHGFKSRRWDEPRAALLGLYQLQHCYGIHLNETHQIPDIECEKYNGRLTHSFLSIQLDASYFGLHQMYRVDGLIAISENMTEDHFDRGTNPLSTQDPDHYWTWVKDRVSHFARHGAEPIDLLILHGTGVTRPEFLQLVREVFADNDKIKAEEYLRTADEHAYAPSKGAAQIAKTGRIPVPFGDLEREKLAKLDGINYVEFRLAFHFCWHRTDWEAPEEDYLHFVSTFSEEVAAYEASVDGRAFWDARIIWTSIRVLNDQEIKKSMLKCIKTKLAYPFIVCGYDLVGNEVEGRTLIALSPLLFWFRKACANAGVEDGGLPFFFHADETLGDGDSTDFNLVDAILLGTRRIGHGFSLYKHPLLVDMGKEKQILVESCPISNEVLPLTGSILQYPLAALLSRSVPTSLNNDDPAIMGYGPENNGLTYEFYQLYLASENLGLEGLGTLVENSVRWSAMQDQATSEWVKGISLAARGRDLKAERCQEWHVEWEKWCGWVVQTFDPETT